MSSVARNPYDEPEESSTAKWVVIFVLLSLLAHAIIIAAILLITIFMPVPKIPIPAPSVTTLTLTPLPPAAPSTPQKPIFVPTTPQANAQHKQQLVESANDHDLTTQSTTARNPNSIMPDVTGKPHASDLNSSPNAPAVQKPQVSSTPPTPKQAKPEKPTPPQPNPQQAQQPPPKTPPPTLKPLPPTPPQKAPPQVDPITGLPVLPPINAQTLAPPNSAAQPLAPAQTQPQQAASVRGALGRHGDNSPAAMASAWGRYKQKVYEAVGSYWYNKVNSQFQILGVGGVHIQFTIYDDGRVQTKVLDPGDSSMQTLLTISINSIRQASPFDTFDAYPGMRQEIIKAQGGDGSSYTDDFTFSIYGQ